MPTRKTHDGPDLQGSVGKQRQLGKYEEQGAAARSNNFTSQGSPRRTPIKRMGATTGMPVNPMDVLAAPRKK